MNELPISGYNLELNEYSKVVSLKQKMSSTHFIAFLCINLLKAGFEC